LHSREATEEVPYSDDGERTSKFLKADLEWDPTGKLPMKANPIKDLKGPKKKKRGQARTY